MKSLEELVDTRKKLEEVNSHITYIWFKLMTPALLVVPILAYGIYGRVAYLNDLETQDTFTCKSFIKDQFNIVVSKKDGWRIEDGYFIKGENKITIYKCKTLKRDSNE